VIAGRLVADLAPKAKDKPADATSFAGLDQAFETTHFLANGGVKVDITPPDASKRIVATAKELDANLLAGTARLTGGAEVPTITLAGAPDAGLVHVAIGATGDNSIEGRLIALGNLLHADGHDDDVTLAVPGPGRFQFTLPADKNRGRKEPTPLDITWTDGMTYDNQTKLAEFSGKTVVQSRGQGADLAKLSAEKILRVQLKNRVAAATTAPAGAAGSVATTKPAEADLELDSIYAEGKVDAGGAHLNELGEMDSWMDLQAEKLTYSDAKKSFQVPTAGKLVVEDKRVAKKDDTKKDAPKKDAGPQGLSTFSWTGSLVYDGMGNLITFSDNVEFNFKPNEPFTFLPGSAGGASHAKDTIATLTAKRLVATLTKPKPEAAGKAVQSPIGMGGDVTLVEATGDATLSVGSDYRVMGPLLSFDVPGNIAKVIGSAEDPVLLERPGELPVTAEQVTWYLKKDGKEGNNAFEMIKPRTNIPGR